MPTVDDLVISLTIKETGKLGKLQKQLEAIVGKKGQLLPTLQIPPKLTHDIDYIRRRMDYLIPVVSPSSREVTKLKMQASSLEKLIDNYRNEIRDFLLGLKAEDLQKIAEDLNVPVDDMNALEVGMSEILEDWQGELDDFRKGRARNIESSKRFMDKVRDILGSLRQKEGERLTALREAIRLIPEAQGRWERIMKKMGVGKEAQFQAYLLKQEIVKGNTKIKDWLEENSEEYEDLKKFFEGAGADVMIPFMKALKQLGYEDDLKNILTLSQSIKDDPQLENLVKAMFFNFSKLTKKQIKNLEVFVPESVKRFIHEELKVLGKITPAIGKPLRLDLMLYDLDNLLKVFPELTDHIEEAQKDIGALPTELKGDYRAMNEKSMERYRKIFGKYLTVIARLISPKGKRILEKLDITGMTYPSIRKVEKRLGIARTLSTMEELSQDIESLTEKIKKEEREEIKEKLGRVYKAITEEQVKTKAEIKNLLLKGEVKEEKLSWAGKQIIDNLIDLFIKYEKSSDVSQDVLYEKFKTSIRDIGSQGSEKLVELNRLLGTNLRIVGRTQDKVDQLKKDVIDPIFKKIEEESEDKATLSIIKEELDKSTEEVKQEGMQELIKREMGEIKELSQDPELIKKITDDYIHLENTLKDQTKTFEEKMDKQTAHLTKLIERKARLSETREETGDGF